MKANMLLLIDVRLDILSYKAKHFDACFGRHLGAWLLQVLGSTMPVRTTECAKVQLHVIVRGHSMSAMDLSGTKEVAISTFVCAKKLSSGEASSHLAHAPHVKVHTQ
jgi:hypothetical protein